MVKSEQVEICESSIIHYFGNAIHYSKKQICDKLLYKAFKIWCYCKSVTTIQWNVNISQLSYGLTYDSKIKSSIQSNKKTKLPVTIQNGEGRKRQYNQSIKQIKLPTDQFKSGLSSSSPSLSSVNCGNEEISAEKKRQVLYRT